LKKIVIAGRNDAGKSTLLGEIYKGLKNKRYQPLAVGSGSQDEKPYLHKGIELNYLTIAVPEPGWDVVEDIERVISNAINKLEERNKLIMHARKAQEELNKVRSVLELGQLTQRDIPKTVETPNVVLVEAVGINDGYKSVETRKLADILVTVIPAGIKSEIIMESSNILLDEADILVITKIDETPRDVTTTTVKLLQRIYPHKSIIPVVATQGVHMALVIDEILKNMIDPLILVEKAEQSQEIKRH
jgi:GTPase Era involved in 16S rRNA processing